MRLVLEVKAAADDSSSPNGTFEAVLSDNSLDRDGEIIDPGAFDPLPDSIPIYTDHEAYTLQSIVGRATPFYDGAGILRVKGFYASTPWAQTVRTLVNEKVVTSMSVGFGSAVREAIGGVPHITKAPLYEGSFVGVPANTNALVMASKAAGGLLVKAFQGILDRKAAGETVDQDLIDEAVRLVKGEDVTEKNTATETGTDTGTDTTETAKVDEVGAALVGELLTDVDQVEAELVLADIEGDLDEIEDTSEVEALEELVSGGFDETDDDGWDDEDDEEAN